MRYCLVNRYRGALLGAFIGFALTSLSDKKYREQLVYRHFKPGAVDVLPMSNAALKSHWGLHAMLLGTKSLIELGHFDIDDWTLRQQPLYGDIALTPHFFFQAIVATLPLTFFFQENTTKLRENLSNMLEIWSPDALLRDGILAVAYTMAHNFTEKFQSHTLIPEIISFLGETPTLIPQTLSHVNSLLERGAGLETAVSELRKTDKFSTSLAIAFYSFLSTKEDFRFCVSRAALFCEVPGAVEVASAMSGAYNSTVGIPVNWQLQLMHRKTSVWGFTNFAQMLKLADALVASWSGVYSQTTQQIAANQKIGVVAAPYVIRVR